MNSRLSACPRWKAWITRSRYARPLTFEEWEEARPEPVRTFDDLDRLYEWGDLKPKRPDVLVKTLP